ncbi:MAG: DedA family protein [Parvularculaceae bacterium]
MRMLTGAALFASVFLLPFFQEDLAVLTAATASLAGAAPWFALLITIVVGLTASDVWKYWLGWFARRYDWAHKFAEKPGVRTAGRLIQDELYKTLLTARFVPGTRIPTYVAAGFFGAPYGPFALYVASTAFLYAAMTFVVFHAVGEVAGERAIVAAPVAAVTLAISYVSWRFARRRSANGAEPAQDEKE